MGGAARVTSIDAVRTIAAALQVFRSDATTALDDLQLEVRRALQWIQHDRKEYWAQEVRRGWERVAEARVQLQQCLTFRRVADQRPSCIDEKRALEVANRRLRTAQEKVETVRHWALAVERAVNEYRGSCSQFSSWLDADFPKALAALEHMTEALEAYVAAPAGQAAAPPLPRQSPAEQSPAATEPNDLPKNQP
jgi:hypothetical protein